MNPQSSVAEFSVEDRILEWSWRVRKFLRKYYQNGIRAASQWRILEKEGERLFAELKAELGKTSPDYLPEVRKALND